MTSLDNSGDFNASFWPRLATAPVEPTAPIESSVGNEVVPTVNTIYNILASNASVSNPGSSVPSRMLKIQLDLKKAQLMKEQLERERLLMEEEFKAKALLIEAEVELAMTKLDDLEDNSQQSSNQSVSLNQQPPNANSVTHAAVLNYILSNHLQKPEFIEGRSSNKIENLEKITLHEQLAVLDNIVVRQLPSPDLMEKYEVLGQQDVVLFRANVVPSLVNTFMSQKTVLHIVLLDNSLTDLATFKYSSEPSMDLIMGGKIIAKVRKPSTFFKQMLILCDGNARPVLKIKGSITYTERNYFSVQTINKMPIGSILKRYGQADVAFPLDLDVNFKIALIASSFLIVDRISAEQRLQKLTAMYPVNCMAIPFKTIKTMV